MLRIENFKSIKELQIDLAPFTIFVGANGSGKSSILEAIAIMHQAADTNGVLLSAIDGDLVKFKEESSVFREENTDLWLDFGFEVKLSESESKKIEEGIEEDLKKIPKEPPSDQDLRDLLVSLKNKEIKRIRYEHKVRPPPQSNYSSLYFLNDIIIGMIKEKGERKYLPKDREIEIMMSSRFISYPYFRFAGGDSTGFMFSQICNILSERVRDVFYLSTERGSLPWEKRARNLHKYVGRKGEYTLEIFSELMKPKHDEKRLPYELFSKEMGIKNAWVGWKREDRLTSNYKDPWLDSAHKFPSLGSGSKQLLPILAQLAFSPPGSIILVEEPEISLHPGYQKKLPALFGKAVNDEKQVLVTSHSSYFPLALSTLLGEKVYTLEGQTTRGRKEYEIKLDIEDIKVYHVKRNSEGYSTVEELEIDENGLKEGIPSFIKVERELLDRFISFEEE